VLKVDVLVNPEYKDCDAGVAMGSIKRGKIGQDRFTSHLGDPKNPLEESKGEGDTDNLVKVISLGE
jgi:hypothetical protein